MGEWKEDVPQSTALPPSALPMPSAAPVHTYLQFEHFSSASKTTGDDISGYRTHSSYHLDDDNSQVS